jgi:GNAT superfamily N-acetyltransferase
MVPMLQHLSVPNQDAILNLKRISGQPSYDKPHVIAMDSNGADNDLFGLPPAARWLAVGYFAEELTSFVQVSGFSSDGYVETMLFVDTKWRRRGFGTLLLNAAMEWASLRRASGARLVCTRTDWSMRHFVDKFGARLDLRLGQMIADIPIGERR